MGRSRRRGGHPHGAGARAARAADSDAAAAPLRGGGVRPRRAGDRRADRRGLRRWRPGARQLHALRQHGHRREGRPSHPDAARRELRAQRHPRQRGLARLREQDGPLRGLVDRAAHRHGDDLQFPDQPPDLGLHGGADGAARARRRPPRARPHGRRHAGHPNEVGLRPAPRGAARQPRVAAESGDLLLHGSPGRRDDRRGAHRRGRFRAPWSHPDRLRAQLLLPEHLRRPARRGLAPPARRLRRRRGLAGDGAPPRRPGALALAPRRRRVDLGRHRAVHPRAPRLGVGAHHGRGAHPHLRARGGRAGDPLAREHRRPRGPRGAAPLRERRAARGGGQRRAPAALRRDGGREARLGGGAAPRRAVHHAGAVRVRRRGSPRGGLRRLRSPLPLRVHGRGSHPRDQPKRPQLLLRVRLVPPAGLVHPNLGRRRPLRSSHHLRQAAARHGGGRFARRADALFRRPARGGGQADRSCRGRVEVRLGRVVQAGDGGGPARGEDRVGVRREGQPHPRARRARPRDAVALRRRGLRRRDDGRRRSRVDARARREGAAAAGGRPAGGSLRVAPRRPRQRRRGERPFGTPRPAALRRRRRAHRGVRLGGEPHPLHGRRPRAGGGRRGAHGAPAGARVRPLREDRPRRLVGRLVAVDGLRPAGQPDLAGGRAWPRAPVPLHRHGPTRRAHGRRRFGHPVPLRLRGAAHRRDQRRGRALRDRVEPRRAGHRRARLRRPPHGASPQRRGPGGRARRRRREALPRRARPLRPGHRAHGEGRRGALPLRRPRPAGGRGERGARGGASSATRSVAWWPRSPAG